jgi:outer membrane protein OmpA-like peptidoglycan-associated protein
VDRKIVSKLCALAFLLGILSAPSLAAARQAASEDDAIIYYAGSAILSLIHIPMKLTTCVGTAVIAGVAYTTVYQVPGGFEEVAREACAGSWLVTSSRVKEDYQPRAMAKTNAQRKETSTQTVMAETPPEVKEAPLQTATGEQAPAEKVVVKEVIKEVPKIVEVEQLHLPDIAFRFDSAELTELGKGRVYLAAQKLKEKSDVALVIGGHADYVGTEEYNEKLGLRRAETVKRELIRLGVNASNIAVESFGESQPLLDQRAGWARAVNRRVEIRLRKK